MRSSPLFRERPRSVQVLLGLVVPTAFGALAGVFLGISAAAYWAIGLIAFVGGTRRLRARRRLGRSRPWTGRRNALRNGAAGRARDRRNRREGLAARLRPDPGRVHGDHRHAPGRPRGQDPGRRDAAQRAAGPADSSQARLDDRFPIHARPDDTPGASQLCVLRARLWPHQRLRPASLTCSARRVPVARGSGIDRQGSSSGSTIRRSSPSPTTSGSTAFTSRPRAASRASSAFAKPTIDSRCLMVGKTSGSSPA